jgi:hypothetical protein
MSDVAHPFKGEHAMCNAKPQYQMQPVLLFPLGKLVATPGALHLLDQVGADGYELVLRHQRGDWGSVPPEDAEQNQFAIDNGCRIMSSYFLSQTDRLWIITEADRSATTLLLPEEY